MQIHVKKRIYHDRLGRLEPGAIVEMNDKQAELYLQSGAVEKYLTKVIREVPFVDTGMNQSSSVLPVEAVLTETIAKPLESGGKKRGRKG